MEVSPLLHHVGPGDASQVITLGSKCFQSLGQPVFVFDTGPEYTAQTGLELVILLPQWPRSWAHRHALPSLALSTSISRLSCPSPSSPGHIAAQHGNVDGYRA